MYIGLHSRDGWLGVARLADGSAYRTVGQIIHNIIGDFFLQRSVGSPVVWLVIFSWPFRVCIECTVDSRYNKFLGPGEVVLFCLGFVMSGLQGQ